MIVIGGGIIGTSVAYYLTKKNVKVVLIEAKDIAAGSSGACDRAIMLQSKNPGPSLELAIESAEIYKTLEKELDEDLEYYKGGGMILIENEFEKKIMQELVERQNRAGLDVSLLSGEQARQKLPFLSNKIIGSTWWNEDAEINPMGTAFAFAKAAYKKNAIIMLNCEVQSLLRKNNQIMGVKTKHGEIYSDCVVICTGVWTKKILETLNMDVPIIPRKGEILVTERLPRLFHSNILSASYIISKLQKTVETSGEGLSIGQTGSGSLLIGGSRRFVGFDSSINNEAIRALAKRAVSTFPFLENVNLIRTFSGFRPFTPDNLPILSDVPSIKGLYIAAGHEGDGVALAPITGKIMADMVCSEKVDVDLSLFSINRFLKERSET